MKRIHIVGHKNSGKTTLVVDLVKEFSLRGYRVGTIKHTHHDHELDTPGKDSHRHRQAGSEAVGILTQGMNAIFWPQQGGKTGEKYSQFDAMMKQLDVVLVEGDSQTTAAKIEVYRTANSKDVKEVCIEPLARTDRSILALVSDDSLDIDTPLWKRSDVGGIVTKLEALFTLSVPGENDGLK